MRGRFGLILVVSLQLVIAHSKPCQYSSLSIFCSPYKQLHQIWVEGKTELYLSGYAWHNRYTYSQTKLKHYNELAWGSGLGKGIYDEKGNWHGLYAFAF